MTKNLYICSQKCGGLTNKIRKIFWGKIIILQTLSRLWLLLGHEWCRSTTRGCRSTLL